MMEAAEGTATTSPLTVAGAVAAAAGVALALRAIKRSFSPMIRSELSCRCGRIRGTISAKREDSIRIYCYCEDCRQYARFIAQLGDRADETIGKPHGDNRVVQVCKSAVTVREGRDLLRLARKGEKKEKQVFMHRFYAGCCHVPLFNTVDFLGFVGVFVDFLDDEHKRFDGPACMFPEQALENPNKREPDINVPSFLWKLVRYLPWAKAGPFDYSLKPVYWGDKKSA